MKILTRSAIESHQIKLVQKQDGQRYSQYPVHEMEFWKVLFAHAKDLKTAQQVLDEIGDIESEPCIENDRVFNNVRSARAMAKVALLTRLV